MSDVSDEDEDDEVASEKIWSARVHKKLAQREKPAGESGDWYSLEFGDGGVDNRYNYPVERIFQSEQAAKIDMFCA